MSPYTQILDEAYIDGIRNGRIDRTLGERSDYAYFGVRLERPGTFAYEYSRGYREGWNRGG